jgi:hypothetical protein
MLWTAALIVLLGEVVHARRLNAAPRITPGQSGEMSLTLPRQRDPEVLLDAVETIADGNLFRPDRSRPEKVPVVAVQGQPPVPQPPKPALKLRGLIGGPPWDVLLEGIPGRDGAVVARVGQTLGGITVRAVRRDTVIAQGMDTTWKLTLVRSW